MAHLSVVVPVYKGEECLQELFKRLTASLSVLTQDYEIIMVEDSGGDRSWEIICDLANIEPRIKGLQFSRNFGQHYGITAGIDHCSGDWVVVMDGDLQDQPEEIPRLYQKAQEGYDVVYARRVVRKDSLVKRFGSRVFYAVFDYLTEQHSDPTVANFGVYSKKVIQAYSQMRESSRAFPLFIRWLGFKAATVDVEHAERFSGKSSYTFTKLVKLALNSIIAQSNRPLRLSIKIGFLMAFGSLAASAWFALRYYLFSIPVAGWTSVMVSIYFLAGLSFISNGFMGLYIGRIYDETKGRPLYVIRESVNFHDFKNTGGGFG